MTDSEGETRCRHLGYSEARDDRGHIRHWWWCDRLPGLPECEDCPRGRREYSPPLIYDPKK